MKRIGIGLIRLYRIVFAWLPQSCRFEPTCSHYTEQAIQKYGEQKQLGLGKIAQPLRGAVSGSTISPPIFQSLEFLGKHRTLARIDRCLSLVR